MMWKSLHLFCLAHNLTLCLGLSIYVEVDLQGPVLQEDAGLLADEAEKVLLQRR